MRKYRELTSTLTFFGLLYFSFIGHSQQKVSFNILDTILLSKKEKTVFYNPISDQITFIGRSCLLKDITTKRNRNNKEYENALYVSSFRKEDDRYILILKEVSLVFFDNGDAHIGIRYSYKIELSFAGTFLNFDRKTVWLDGDWDEP